MKALLGNVLLALAWTAMTGRFEPGDFLAGLLFGFLGLWLLGDVLGTRAYVRSVLAAASLCVLFVREATVATARIAADVLTPGVDARPAVLAVPLAARGDLELLLLSTLIALTPGSVVLDVARDRSTLYVYSMYVDDPEKARRRLQHVFERGVLALTRPAR